MSFVLIKFCDFVRPILLTKVTPTWIKDLQSRAGSLEIFRRRNIDVHIYDFSSNCNVTATQNIEMPKFIKFMKLVKMKYTQRNENADKSHT